MAHKPHPRFTWVSWFGLMTGMMIVACPSTTVAQIAGDGTLGTQVNGDLTAPCTGVCIITDGTPRGRNLFHSFTQFSLPDGDFAGFVTAPTIQNVLVRVTGQGSNYISTINGAIATINAAGTAINPANFFLLNPNGIIFGPNASLLIGGSFLATTANRMLFQDGTQFSTTAQAPLLTISVPIGLQIEQTPREIRMQRSFFSAGTSDDFTGFVLVGGDVTLDNSIIQAPGHRVELAAVGENGTVGLRLDSDRLKLNFAVGTAHQDVSLINDSSITASASKGGGEVGVTGRNIILDDSEISTRILPGIDNAATNQAGDITINAETDLLLTRISRIDNSVEPNATGQGGNIQISATNFQARGGSSILASTFGNGDVGKIQVMANNIALDGVSPSGRSISGIVSQVSSDGNGRGGDVTIQTNSLNITNGAAIVANTYGSGDAGNVQVSSNTISLDGTSPNGQTGGILSYVGPTGKGRSGDVTVQARLLNITNSAAIASNTYGNGDAGNVRVTANTISLDGTSLSGSGLSGLFSRVESTGIGHGGNIAVETTSLKVINGAVISASTLGYGNGGNVGIVASTIDLDGAPDNQPGGIGSQVENTAIGNGGNITIQTNTLTVTNGAVISAGTSGYGSGGNVSILAHDISLDGFTPNAQAGSGIGSNVLSTGVGHGGDVTLQTDSLTILNGAAVTAGTAGNGNGGNIQVTANTIGLDGTTRNDQLVSGIGSQVTSTGNGRGGNVNVQAGFLTVTRGALISGGTFGDGDGGNVQVTAHSIVLDGTTPNGQLVSGIGSQVAPTGNGRGGDVTVETSLLSITNGAAISASTFGLREAGNVFVAVNAMNASGGGQIRTSTASASNSGGIVLNVSDRLTLSGPNTGLFANTTPGSSGNGGSIFIDPRIVTVQDGAKIAVDSQGSGAGGDIFLQAGRLELRDRGSITAETASAQGGNITLDVNDLLLLRRNSLISATAGTAQAGGDGGNVTIRTPFVVGVLNENSDIIANAFTGRGGNINITTNAIYGLQFQSKLTPLSDITASSEFGISGTVAITTLNIDPNRGLVALPVNLTDPSQEISQACNPTSKTAASSFVATGRGGLPLNPEEPLERGAVVSKWVPLPEDVEESGVEGRSETVQSPIDPSSIVEVQGWMVDADGAIKLVAHISNHPVGYIWPVCSSTSPE